MLKVGDRTAVADPGGGGGGGRGYTPPPPPLQNLLLKINDFLRYARRYCTERVNGATILPIVVGGVIVINVPAHRM